MVEDEQIIVDRFCAGDMSVFKELVEIYKKKVYFLAYDLTVKGDSNEYTQIIHQTFWDHCWGAIERFHHAVGFFYRAGGRHCSL